MSKTYTVKERFLKYVQIDTQSDPYATCFPSTEKQKDLSRVLVEELQEMGVSEVEMDENGYVYARIPSNQSTDIPGIFFCAHVDTAPDCSGTNVKPIVHENYQGQDIILPDDTTQVLTEDKYPNLKAKHGHDIITASGLTLLGSDDKSGVAVIMDMMYQLVNNPDIPHGDVCALFTPDEEVGRGTEKVNIDKIKAEFGYTLDSGDLGHFEYENFSANAASIKITGVSAHPGYAKGKMQSAIKIASAIVDRLPKESLSPETTSGKEGFIHPNKISGHLESAEILFIIRDFETENLAKHQGLLQSIMDEVLAEYPGAKGELIVREQYRNMRDVIQDNMHIVDIAVEGIKAANVEPHVGAIRGGTDGAMLTYKGLPCPNIFAGEQAIHSKHEWVSVQDMQKAVDSIVNICQIWANRH